jgi:hypothetical protein
MVSEEISPLPHSLVKDLTEMAKRKTGAEDAVWRRGCRMACGILIDIVTGMEIRTPAFYRSHKFCAQEGGKLRALYGRVNQGKTMGARGEGGSGKESST